MRKLKIACPSCQNDLEGLVNLDLVLRGGGGFIVICNSCGVRSRFSMSAVYDEDDAIVTYKATSLGLEGFEISEEAFLEYVKWVARVGKERRLQPDFNQADFCAGAMVAFFAAGMADKVPMLWLFGTMEGRDIFANEN